jgi:Domain of unknown function (DUF4386)
MRRSISSWQAGFRGRVDRGGVLCGRNSAPLSSIQACGPYSCFVRSLISLVGLSLEALEFHLHGVNVALIFHGLYCILIGLLMFRSVLLPRALGILMTIGGFAWLTDLSIPFTNQLGPYNVGVGFLGEGLPMLWLLIIGVNDRAERARATEQRT